MQFAVEWYNVSVCRSHSIQSVNYDGQDFRLILYNNHLLQHPFSISVFENWVYWSDWKTNSINRVSEVVYRV